MKIETIEQLANKLAQCVPCWRIVFGFIPIKNRITSVRKHLGSWYVECEPSEGYAGKSFLVEFGHNSLWEFHCEDEPQPKMWLPRTAQVAIGIPQAFLDFCEERGVKPADVLAGFIGDLCGIEERGPFNQHGSDERRLAMEWFERVDWGYAKKDNDDHAD